MLRNFEKSSNIAKIWQTMKKMLFQLAFYLSADSGHPKIRFQVSIPPLVLTGRRRRGGGGEGDGPTRTLYNY